MSDPAPAYTPVNNDEPFAEAVQVAEVPHIQQVVVTAPSDLPEGFAITVTSGGRPFTVRVPEGGVREGEKFLASTSAIPEADAAHRIPVGHWRDGICDCGKHGFCHPMLCLTLFCSPLALGQVMTRMNLHPCPCLVSQTRRSAYWSAFKILALMLAAYILVDEFLATLLFPYMSKTGDSKQPTQTDLPAWAAAVFALRQVLHFGFAIYILVLIIRTRAYIRSRYGIPEAKCRGCEDCCCSYWCSCCTILQMARHTADYETYRAACCSETGLPPNAPQIV